MPVQSDASPLRGECVESSVSRGPRAARRERSFAAGAALALLALLPGAPASQGPVALPPLWYAGDTHAHVQACADDPDIPLPVLYAQQQQSGLAVSSVLLWNNLSTPQGVADYYELYAPLVDGEEAALTRPDPDHWIQYGVEVSGFNASDFGHVSALGIADGAFPDEYYPAPILDFFRAQPGALTGYAHARWFTSYQPPLTTLLSHPGSATAAVDLALGKIDFVEEAALPDNDSVNVQGLLYKLLNAGLRVALTGGSDNTCIASVVGVPRGYARIDSDPLTYTEWLEAVRAGRTTVSPDEHSFLDLAVESVGIGGELRLAQPGPVEAVATLRVAQGYAKEGRLQLVHDGNLAATQPYDLPSGGLAVLKTQLQVDRSGWIAARTEERDHTSAVYVIVEDEPICRALDAGYWASICDQLVDNLGLFQTGGQAQEIVDHLLEGKKVFAALAACDGPLPPGVQKLGVSTPACQGPLAIGITEPPAAGSTSFALTCLNAPPYALGVLSVGTQLAGATADAPGAIGLASLQSVLPVTSNGGGYAEEPLALPAQLAGTTLVAQFVWTNPPTCPGPQALSASDVLVFTVP